MMNDKHEPEDWYDPTCLHKSIDGLRAEVERLKSTIAEYFDLKEKYEAIVDRLPKTGDGEVAEIDMPVYVIGDNRRAMIIGIGRNKQWQIFFTVLPLDKGPLFLLPEVVFASLDKKEAAEAASKDRGDDTGS